MDNLTKCLMACSLVFCTIDSKAQSTQKDPVILQTGYDVVIAGATPGGLAVGIRCAREGYSVLIVEPMHHLGGMISSGLGTMDTYYYKARSPIYDELCQRIVSHYQGLAFDPSGFKRQNVGEHLRYESHVAEKALHDMVSAEKNMTVVLGFYPKTVERTRSEIRTVRFSMMNNDSSFLVRARIFVDATYEGDLAALAGVPYRVGREARSEFNEPHAGRSFTKLMDTGDRPESIHDIEVGMHGVSSRELESDENGEGDGAIQAYNYRLALSNDPDNMRMPAKPDNYDPESYQLIRERLGKLPNKVNSKIFSWNVAILPGGNHDYPNAGWELRREIAQRHLDWAIGVLHYVQEGSAGPTWGLALDEYIDNENVPYMMYVREARRIIGRKVFTENDGLLAEGLNRAPIHAGSIAITEWSLDSHGCTPDRIPGSRPEGKVLLSEITVPGQVDFDCLLDAELSNFIVPLCLSSTHIGWGTIRLEPTWMHIGESAGFAAALALKQGVALSEIDRDVLQCILAEERIILSYFNDIDMLSAEKYVPATQYLGTKGFFPTYNALPDQPLDIQTAVQWVRMAGMLLSANLDPYREAAVLYAIEQSGSKPAGISHVDFASLLRNEINSLGIDISEAKINGNVSGQQITRGEASQIIYQLITKYKFK